LARGERQQLITYKALTVILQVLAGFPHWVVVVEREITAGVRLREVPVGLAVVAGLASPAAVVLAGLEHRAKVLPVEMVVLTAAIYPAVVVVAVQA
jgi:hypothetical protein